LDSVSSEDDDEDEDVLVEVVVSLEAADAAKVIMTAKMRMVKDFILSFGF
jgi:hypothetical protein